MAKRKGFTVLELLVGLSIGAIALLAARVLLEQIAAAGPRIRTARESVDAMANAELWLREAVGQIDGEAIGTRPSFYGSRDTAKFQSWCRVPRGWTERCDGVLIIERDNAGMSAIMRLGDYPPVIVGHDSVSLELRYVAPSDSGISIASHWDSSVLPPAGIAIVAAHDTLFLRIGKRG